MTNEEPPFYPPSHPITGLLDEARPDWGVPLEAAKTAEFIVDKNGKVLMTLADCYKAKEALEG